ncbi:MAG: FimV/HubP family polar landmark protein [Pseudomonadota bacterium]|nr:FimV/HubP family polar landmark protein [Pseudomonadota bacterium]
MNIKKLFILIILSCFPAFAQSNTVDQAPMISRLDSMEANLHKLEDNERTLFAQNQALSSRLNSSTNNVNKPTAMNDIFILMIISGLVVFLVLAGCLERQPKQRKQMVPKKNKQSKLPEIKREHQDEEYDFMGSQEAVPARFNLAEAYMQMREFRQAKRVLEGILDQGDSDQRQKASALLSQLPSL